MSISTKELKDKFLKAYESTRKEPVLTLSQLKKKYGLEFKHGKSKNTKEDLEMIKSKNYQESIKKARNEI